ncbi:MAG: flavodoxin [Atopobiaceae bacterium]|jgi:flavodoxin|nr:flavodoxin [Atopobiaceae bacterium]
MNKKLVAYFSATGTTGEVARKVARAAGADLFEIEPVERYTAADLDWNDRTSRSSREMADEAARPAMASCVEGMGSYEAVFVGFPIWWYVEPRIVDAFLEAYDLSGKVVIPFATSGGSGLGQAPRRMRALCPGADVREGKRLSAGASQGSIDAWVSGLGA